MALFKKRKAGAPGRRLIELDFFIQAAGANGVQQSESAHGVHICRILRQVEGHFHVTLRTQVVNLTGQMKMGKMESNFIT